MLFLAIFTTVMASIVVGISLAVGRVSVLTGVLWMVIAVIWVWIAFMKDRTSW